MMKKMKNSFDLSVRYPNYFNKWVFRFGFLIIISFFLLVVLLELFNNPVPFNYAYVSCPVDKPFCVNPFYVCSYPFEPDCVPLDSIPVGVCSYGYCDDKFLVGGVSYGSMPPFYLRHSIGFISLVLLLSFLFNHLLYKMRSVNIK